LANHPANGTILLSSIAAGQDVFVHLLLQQCAQATRPSA
jgi:hypothetical protein